MDIHTLHTDAELANLLRLIRDVKASGHNPGQCDALEGMVLAIERALKNTKAGIEDALGPAEGARDSVDACIIAASFVAGVQAQMISFTHQSNNNGTQIAANLFAFVGMTLDVIGASSGVACVILLRRSIERSKLLLMHFNAVRRRIYANVESICVNADMQGMDRIMEEMQVLSDLCQKAQELAFPDALPLLCQLVETLHPLYRFLFLPTVILFAINRGLPGFSLVPLVTIVIGTLCLMISVLTFAATSQLSGVWVVCVVITGAALILLLVLRVLNIPGNQREAEYKELENRLREALRGNLNSVILSVAHVGPQ